MSKRIFGLLAALIMALAVMCLRRHSSYGDAFTVESNLDLSA